jgi:hypothetical protein
VEDRTRFYRYSRDGDIPKHHLRFNMLNQPGIGIPSTEGIISHRNSAQGARVLQNAARITW